MGCASGIAKYILFLFNLLCAKLNGDSCDSYNGGKIKKYVCQIPPMYEYLMLYCWCGGNCPILQPLAGLALLIVGVLYKLNVTEVTDIIPEDFDALSTVPILLIVVGSIVFIIAFFGCCGAVKESTCMLTTYAVILLVLFILQIAFGVVAFLQIKDTDDLRKTLTEGFRKQFDKYGSNNASRIAVDNVQQALQCCGVNSPADWLITSYAPFPNSCCEGNTKCLIPFTAGCSTKLFDFTEALFMTIGIVVICIAAVELVGAIFALCLSSSIKNQSRRGAYA